MPDGSPHTDTCCPGRITLALDTNRLLLCQFHSCHRKTSARVDLTKTQTHGSTDIPICHLWEHRAGKVPTHTCLVTQALGVSSTSLSLHCPN